jgi:hypothetical protein
MGLHIKVYWTDKNHTPQSNTFSSLLDADPLGLALKLTQEKRNAGMTHVVMSTENSDQVGKPGVDAVEDGKTPDGEIYDWSKAGRAGKTRRK